MKKLHKILISDYASALEDNYEPTILALKNALGKDFDAYEIEVYSYENEKALSDKLANCDGLITGFLEIGQSVLEKAPNLKCISVSGVGYSNIDVAAAKAHGVEVCHIAEYCTQEVAEHTFALIGALNRNLKYYDHKVEKEQEWKYHTISGGHTLSRQTLGIFGFGKIGRKVATIAKGYGMRVVAFDPYAKMEDANSLGVVLLDANQVLRESDVITNHMNLTEENASYFNMNTFKQMERNPIFINVGRGGSVVEKDLVEALNQGLIRGAGLDVLEAEDPDLAHCELLGRENVILTPHSAFYSEDSIEALQRISGENLGYSLSGQKDFVFSYCK